MFEQPTQHKRWSRPDRKGKRVRHAPKSLHTQMVNDIKIAAWTYRHRWTDEHCIAALLKVTKRRATQILRDRCSRGYLREVGHDLTRSRVWKLTKKGAEIAVANRHLFGPLFMFPNGLRADTNNELPQSRFLHHELIVQRQLLAFNTTIQEAGGNLKHSWLHREWRIAPLDFMELTGRDIPGFTPDLCLQYQDEHGQEAIEFVEIQLSSEAPESRQRRLYIYDQVMRAFKTAYVFARVSIAFNSKSYRDLYEREQPTLFKYDASKNEWKRDTFILDNGQVSTENYALRCSEHIYLRLIRPDLFETYQPHMATAIRAERGANDLK